MKAVIANDHGGAELAAKLKGFLESRGCAAVWLGVPDESVSADYPDKAVECVAEFRKGGYDFGVLVCGTGIGMSICANKEKGIRCALPQNAFAARMAKEHNAANFIAFGGRIDYSDDPCLMLSEFMDAEVSEEERHVRRRKKFLEK